MSDLFRLDGKTVALSSDLVADTLMGWLSGRVRP